ncbi:MAG: PilZ domain-containing protein [Marinobacter sp.]
MEHRLSQRTEGELSILVYKRGIPVAIGQIQDASRSGLFIATDYSDVRLNQTIELAFRYPENQGQSHRVLAAHVVRQSANGLGLDFDGVDNDAITVAELIDWLQSQGLYVVSTNKQRKTH